MKRIPLTPEQRQRLDEDLDTSVTMILLHSDLKPNTVCSSCGQTIYKDTIHYQRTEFSVEGGQIGPKEYFCGSQCLYRYYAK